MRRTRDCDIRVAEDSALEEIYGARQDGLARVVYKTHKNFRLTAKQIQESEGVLMIVLHNSIFGYIKIIVFQLALWIGIIMSVGKSCCEAKVNMLAFSYSAVPSRHDVSVMLTD